MTSEERDIITRFIERVSGATALSGSVPSASSLPAVDRQADALIGDLFTRYPDARYRLTQTAFVQEHALVEAQTRIARLEAELQSMRQAGPSQQQPSRGFFGGLFGGGQAAPQQQQPQYQPQPQYQQPQYQQPQYAPPGYQPGMFQRAGGGSGFLGSALTTAAGVAGGMVAGNALMNLFSGGEHHAGGFGGGTEQASSPWGGGAVEGGGWDNQATPSDPSPGGSGWDNVVDQPDPSGGGIDTSGGGWDSGSGGFDSSDGGGFDDTST